MQQKARFDIEGMTCQACANRIEKVLNKKDFISEAGVNFASEDAQITFDSSKTSPEAIAQIIEKTGYKATLHTDGAQPDITSNTQLGWRLWLLILINIPFLIGMAGMMSGHHEWMMPAMVQFALASVVQLWLAWPFYWLYLIPVAQELIKLVLTLYRIGQRRWLRNLVPQHTQS